MTAQVIPIETRLPPVLGHQFECLGCESSVYSAIHFGNRRMCGACQMLGPDMSRAIQEEYRK